MARLGATELAFTLSQQRIRVSPRRYVYPDSGLAANAVNLFLVAEVISPPRRPRLQYYPLLAARDFTRVITDWHDGEYGNWTRNCDLPLYAGISF